jgi:hypothetical protein
MSPLTTQLISLGVNAVIALFGFFALSWLRSTISELRQDHDNKLLQLKLDMAKEYVPFERLNDFAQVIAKLTEQVTSLQRAFDQRFGSDR